MLPNFFRPQDITFLIKTIVLVMFVFIGCSDERDQVVAPQNKLNAQAGSDQTGVINTEIILDASASTSRDGSPFEYAWTLKYKPAGSTATIVNAGSRAAAFTPDKEGVYTISLTISQGSLSDSDDVRILVTRTDDPEEPQTIFIQEDIVEEAVLKDIFTDPARPDYIVTGNIHVKATLTIQAGVIIEFEQDQSMQVILGGALIAEGTATQPVVFTGTQKQQGHWKGLMFATNNNLNKLHYSIVEYGGSSELPESPRTNISVPGDAISGSVVNLSNSIVRHSGGCGLYVGGMSYLTEFSEMAFAHNAGAAIYCSPRNVSRVESHTAFNGNGFNGVETGGVLNEVVLVSWYPLIHGAYRLSSDLTVASKLEIVNGSVFKISKNILITVAPEGILLANGTADTKIVFEGASTIADNAWRGILIRSAHENSMDHVIVRNAGYSVLPNMTSVRANIGVAAGANLTITNSLLDRSAGWGIALEEHSYYNEDIHTANDFISVTSGSVLFPEQRQPIDVAGEWVDESSFASARYSINENFYNRQTGQWFEGADNPWAMSPQPGFGLKVDEAGQYIWTIAVQHSPPTECFAYSAEHFTGQVVADGEFLNFQEYSWRSKYFNSCAPEESMDIEVRPGQMKLPYEVSKEYNVFTGEQYWVLTITSGGEAFKLYKK